MDESNFSKINKSLEKNRHFTTIWCTLGHECIPYLQSILRPLIPYCDWLSTFGDVKKDGKYLPHISLRYLGFSDELNIEKLVKDKDKFSNAMSALKITKINLGSVNVWEQKSKEEIVVARLNWKILDITPLRKIHENLLQVSGYQFFENLEGSNFNPHISLGQIKLEDNNYLKIKDYLENQKFKTQKVGLEKFAINYAYKDKREEFELS